MYCSIIVLATDLNHNKYTTSHRKPLFKAVAALDQLIRAQQVLLQLQMQPMGLRVVKITALDLVTTIYML